MGAIGPISVAGSSSSPFSKVALKLADLQSYWRVGESSGTKAVDVVGGRHGTYIASPTLSVRGALASDPDTAITLNGTTQYVTAPDTGLPATNAARTIVSWINPSALVANHPIFAYGINTAHNWFVWYVTSSGVLTLYDGADGVSLSVGGAITTGKWWMVSVGYDGTTAHATINGQPALSAAIGLNTTLSGTLYIGSSSAGTDFFHGSKDEVLVYARNLGAGELATLYAAGNQ